MTRAVGMLAAVLAITFASLMLYATLGERIQSAIASAHVRRWFQRTVGATFVALGAGLALEQR